MSFADWQESVSIVAGDFVGWALAVFAALNVLLAASIPALGFARRWLNKS